MTMYAMAFTFVPVPVHVPLSAVRVSHPVSGTPRTVRPTRSSSSGSGSASALHMNMNMNMMEDLASPAALQKAMGLESTSILQALETFDGSTITDPVVISGVFWSSLKTKILSVIIGQFLASIVFGVLAYVLSSQFSKIGDYISNNVFKENSSTRTRTGNRDAVQNNVQEFAQNVKQKSQSPPTITITPDVGKLCLCLLIDVLGTSSELLPIIGEFTDIAFAPAAALALRSLFQGSNVVFALEFVEEILPFTDILPLATICWVVETYFGDSDVARALQIGVYGAEYGGGGGGVVGDGDGDGIVNERSGRGSGRSGSGSGSNFNGNGVIDVEAEAQLPDRPRLGDSGINRNDRRS